jgi:2-deoxy-D-gluconate 3-dehydrogenase
MSDQASIFQRLFSLSGKVAIVTGAGGGIGRVLASSLAQAGADIALHDIKADLLTEVAAEIAALGRRTVCLAADLADVEACRRLVADAHRQLGRIDILINCAGMNRRKPIADVTLDDFDTITAVNLRSVYFLSQAVHPIMKAQGGGKIVNIGSLTSSVALGTVSVYGATKAAVAQLTKTQAIEWAKDNIQINCLAPGYMLTPLTAKALWADEQKKRWMTDRIALRRAGMPEDLVTMVLCLVAPGTTYLTGQLISIDGGALAGGSWEKD